MKKTPNKLTFEFANLDTDARLRELVLYICEKCAGDPTFGATKLNKILFFSDFLSYADTGKPITGAEYQKLEWGPAPKRLLPIQKKLISERALAIQEIRKGGNTTQKRPVALRRAKLNECNFTGDEIAKVDAIIDTLKGYTATTVSMVSHKRAWRITENNSPIPYEAALLSDDGLTDYEINRARELSLKYGWEN